MIWALQVPSYKGLRPLFAFRFRGLGLLFKVWYGSGCRVLCRSSISKFLLTIYWSSRPPRVGLHNVVFNGKENGNYVILGNLAERYNEGVQRLRDEKVQPIDVRGCPVAVVLSSSSCPCCSCL